MTTLTAPVEKILDAVRAYTSVPAPDENADLPTEITAEHEKVRTAALEALRPVLRIKPTEADLRLVRAKDWIADLDAHQVTALAGMIQKLAPLNVVVYGGSRLWALNAGRSLPNLY